MILVVFALLGLSSFTASFSFAATESVTTSEVAKEQLALPSIRPIRPEIEASTDAKLVLNSKGDAAFALGGGYHHPLSDEFQLSFRMTLVIRDRESGGTIFSPTLGPTVNLSSSGNYENSFFVGPFVGLWYNNSIARNPAHLAWGLSTGKRFLISQPITWKPEFRIDGITRDQSSVAFSFIPVQFSFFF